jgi:hypothetical protein
MVLVSKPVVGIEMQLHIALMNFAGEAQCCPAKIRAAIAIVVTGIDDFDDLRFGGSQQLSGKTALQPELMQCRFGKLSLSKHHTLPDKFAGLIHF